MQSNRAATHYGVVDQKDHDRTGNGDKHAVEIQAGNTLFAEEAEQISPDNGAYNSQADVQPEPLASSIDDLASDEAGDKSEHDPAQDTHLRVSFLALVPVDDLTFRSEGTLIQIKEAISQANRSSRSRAGMDPRRLDMTEQIQSGLISRRTAFSLLAALGATTAATIQAVSNARAQTPGMERREERREDRQDRREERRDDRQDRREDRRDVRENRRDDRRGVGDQPATTGSSAPK
jgi:hypothetical protein